MAVALGGLKAFNTVLSIVGTVTGLISFTQDLLPKSDAPSTTLNVAVAIEPEGGKASFGGRVDVRLFNTFGERLGPPVVDKFINTGNSKGEIIYKHDRNHEGQQAAYALLTGNDDAICIAWVSATWADGSNWVFMGDWAHPDGCGNAPWAYSNLVAGNDKDGPHSAKCIWIDKNGDSGPQTAFQVYFPDFAAQSDGSFPTDKNVLCDTPSFMTSTKPDNNGIVFYNPPKQITNAAAHVPTRRRDVTSINDDNNNNNNNNNTTDVVADPWAQNTDPSTWTTLPGTKTPNASEVADGLYNNRRARRHENRLLSSDDRVITSSNPQHLASALCNSDSSWGPSFISKSEGTFCDMKTKTLYTLCGEGVPGECFDEATMSVVVGASVAGRIKVRNAMRFSKVLEWDNNNSSNGTASQ